MHEIAPTTTPATPRRIAATITIAALTTVGVLIAAIIVTDIHLSIHLAVCGLIIGGTGALLVRCMCLHALLLAERRCRKKGDAKTRDLVAELDTRVKRLEVERQASRIADELAEDHHVSGIIHIDQRR